MLKLINLEDAFFARALRAWDGAVSSGLDEPHTVHRFATELAKSTGIRGDGYTLRIATGFVHQNTRLQYRSKHRARASREAGDLLVVVTVVTPGKAPERRALLMQAKMAATVPSFLYVGRSLSALEQHYLYKSWPRFSYSWTGSLRTRQLVSRDMQNASRYLLIPRSVSSAQIPGMSKLKSALSWKLGATASPVGKSALGEHSLFICDLVNLMYGGGKVYEPGNPTSDWHGFVDDLLRRATTSAYPKGGLPRAYGSVMFSSLATSGKSDAFGHDGFEEVQREIGGRGMIVLRLTVVSDDADFFEA